MDGLRRPEIYFADKLNGIKTTDVEMTNFNKEMKRNCGSVDYYTKDSTVFIHAYHPAQTMVIQEHYCNDIIEAVRIWNDGSNNSDSNES